MANVAVLSMSGVREGLPPGPRMPAIIQAGSLWLRPLAFLDDCAKRYGDCFTLRIPTRPPMVIFSHPEAVKEIFAADPDELRAGEANVILEPILGTHSLLLLDGAQHLRERRLMLPSFHGERMRYYGNTMRATTDRVIDRWPLGSPFPIHPEMQRITLEVIFKTVFGLENGDHERLREKLVELISIAVNPVWLMPFMRWNFGPWARVVRLKHDVHDLLTAEIRARRAGSVERQDVLSILIAARDENGEPMSEEELRDEMITLLLAGHETTATALAWSVHRLIEHPAVLERVRAELHDVIGERPVEPEHVGKLEYLEAFVKEVMRLNPIIPEVGRLLTHRTHIGGWKLPAGAVAAPSIYLTQRRADVWSDPERFDPERFLGARPLPHEYFPFGGGVRRCIGMAFAIYEMKIVLAELLQRVSFRAAPGYAVRPVRRSITLAPSRGVPVVVDARH
jgi:cytochrome P450